MSQHRRMADLLAVDQDAHSLAEMIARAVLIPDDRNVSAMIRNIVETEIFPRAVWHEGIHLKGIEDEARQDL